MKITSASAPNAVGQASGQRGPAAKKQDKKHHGGTVVGHDMLKPNTAQSWIIRVGDRRGCTTKINVLCVGADTPVLGGLEDRG